MVCGEARADVFKQTTQPKLDIAFIIDDSASMGAFQKSLSANLHAFVNWAVRLNKDYQIMVTTTDTTGTRFPAGCARGSTKIINPKTPNPVAVFQANANVGVGGSSQQKGLEAAYRMFSPPASTGCNKGFLRKDASLSLIFVSSRADNSPQPVHFYSRFFKSLKGIRFLERIRASAVVGPPPRGCKKQHSTAIVAPRYWSVSRELKGVQTSICGQWSGTLSAVGVRPLFYKSYFYLSRQADAQTIRVKVNGKLVKEGWNGDWVYDAKENRVTFRQYQGPAFGATVQVEYKAVCLP